MVLNKSELKDLGLKTKDIPKYLSMMECDDYASQIEILRSTRYRILDTIHEFELKIHKIDYLINEINSHIKIRTDTEE